jgi:hypothetical protein
MGWYGLDSYCRAYMWRLYIWWVLDWQLDLLDLTQLQLQCVHSYSSLQFTTTLAESSHCIFTGFLSSNIAGSVRLQLCNSSLKTAARPEYSLVTANSVDLTVLTTGSRPSLYSLWTDHKENTHCCIGCYCLGTDLIQNAAFPLLRSRLRSDHIENMSPVVCLATVVNKRFLCGLLTYSVHVTIWFRIGSSGRLLWTW